MPEIRPFRGIRYNLSKIKNLADVITQPYDQITDEMEKEYKRRSPYNFVNLVLTHYADGHDRKSEYENARNCVNNWLRDGIFVQEKEESIYPYFQEFYIEGKKYIRKGFICRLRLEELGKKDILPHEKTLSKPKEDRLNLTRITKKDFEPVFLLYTDPENKVMGMIEEQCKEPVIDVVDDRAITHKLWKLSEPELIEKIASTLRDSILVIADGHHRYETALNYRNELGGLDKNHPANFKMVTLVNIQDPGLVILPTHRLVMNLKDFNIDDFILKVKNFFDVRKVSRNEIKGELEKEKKHTFGFYSPQHIYLLKLKDITSLRRLLPERSEEYRDLDVAILHTLLIEELLGIKPEKVEDHIRYQRGIEETLSRVDSGEFQMAFLMNPTRPEQVRAVAMKRERMPQKSTDFYPKLISGLVFYDIAGD
ncbi:MAG: DUF1015 domain-containing protein [candidate division WOR-3 bacterium]|nr:DUF1015 domain-containing protein [candidate division WOR-3 bacterium]